MINDSIKIRHARYTDRMYPCGYCINHGTESVGFTLGNARVINSTFADNEKCLAGCDKPDKVGDCSRFWGIDLDFKRHCVQETFEILERDYMMFVIARIDETPGIKISTVADRKAPGSQTRRTRIKELIDLDFVIADDNRLYLTDAGLRIAKSIRGLYDEVIISMHEGDIFSNQIAMMIFEFIYKNPKCSKKQIYDYMNKNVQCTEIIERMLDAKYIVSRYDESNWDMTLFDVTPIGIMRYEVFNGKT